jgi:hypothetical protein
LSANSTSQPKLRITELVSNGKNTIPPRNQRVVAEPRVIARASGYPSTSVRAEGRIANSTTLPQTLANPAASIGG